MRYTPEQQRQRHNAAVRRWRKRNPERVKLDAARYRKKNPHYQRNWVWDKKGITLVEVARVLRMQKNCCAICRKPFHKAIPMTGMSPTADHCHSTGKFRGMIHRKCNSGLGFFNDNPRLLRLAAAYLERNK